MSFTIRVAMPADAHSIAETQAESWCAAYRDILPKQFLRDLDVGARERMWSVATTREDLVILVAFDDEGMVGFAAGGAARDVSHERGSVSEITAIYLLERAWSSGLGRTLFTDTCDVLRSRGFAELIVWVFESNVRGCDFYERMGMSVEAAAEKFFEAEGVTLRVIQYRANL